MRQHIAFTLLFIGYVLWGLTIVDDYGMSWDEAVQRQYGLVTADFVAEKLKIPWDKFEPDKILAKNPGKEYTVLFTTICAGLERVLGLEDDFRGRFLLRHRMVFLLFSIGIVFFYLLIFRLLRNVIWSLLGTSFLLLSPRIFAHSFFNPKDIILLSTYLIASYTLVRLVFTPTWQLAIIHGLTTAVAINSRFPALIIPAITALIFVLQLLQLRGRRESRKYFPILILYAVTTVLFTFMLFPYLWEAPIDRANRSFQMMAKFPWGSHNLFFGSFVLGEDIPWYYIPSWIGITTPLFYIVCFCIGLIFTFQRFIKNLKHFKLWSNEEEGILIILLNLLLGPIFAVILFQSTLYNGWRQLYFIYPSMLAIGIFGVYNLWSNATGRFRNWMVVCLLISHVTTIYTMIEHHPNQQVYFNFLAGKDLTARFDFDYWGVAYYQAWQELSNTLGETKERVKVKCANYPCEDNFRFLPDATKQKVELVWDIEKADYFMSNYRRPVEHNKFMNGIYPYQHLYLSIDYKKNPIIGIYQLRRTK